MEEFNLLFTEAKSLILTAATPELKKSILEQLKVSVGLVLKGIWLKLADFAIDIIESQIK